MRLVLSTVLMAVLLCFCCTAEAAKRAAYPTGYTAHILDPNPVAEPAEAWFLDNQCNVIGPANVNGSSMLNIWQPHKKVTRLAAAPDEASYYIMAVMTWNVRPQRMNKHDEMLYATDGSSVGVVDLLTGKTRTLGKLPGIALYTAVDINDNGVCVGNACRGLESGDPTLPILWPRNGKPRLLALPTGCTNGHANGINSRGQIIGNAWSDYWLYEARVVIWNSDGTIASEIPPTPEEVMLGTAPSGQMISDNGCILLRAAWSYDLVSPTGTRTLIAYPVLGEGIFAMNSHGQLAGYDNEGAVIFNPDGTRIHLPPPIPGAYCTAYDVNDDGVAVGSALAPDSSRWVAVMWTPSR